MRQHKLFPALPLLVGLVLGCGSDTVTNPDPGTVVVSITTTGEDPDPDGYTVKLDRVRSRSVGANETTRFPDISPGNHDVELSGIADNCLVQGENPQSVAVQNGRTSTVSFTVRCETTTGDLQVITSTAGDTLDTDGYSVTVNDTLTRSLAPNDSVTITRLDEGEYRIKIEGIQRNCSIDGSSSRPLNVVAGETTTTTYDISCDAALFNRILFSEEGTDHDFTLFAMKPDGSARTQITGDATSDFEVDISSTGTHIAFVSHRDGNHEVYLSTVDQSSVTRLTASRDDDRYPAISPDGKQVVFSSDRDGDDEIYIINRDGTDLRQVTVNSASDTRPSWTSDGEKIVFNSDRDGDRELFEINRDGTGLRQITDNSVRDDSPAPSPNNSRIAAMQDFDIVTMNGEGREVHKLTSHPDWDSWPDWSPDGNQLVFGSVRSGSWDIYRIDADGENLERLTDNDLVNFRDPSWSPDRNQ